MSGPAWCACGCSRGTSQRCDACGRTSCFAPQYPCCSAPALRPLRDGELDDLVQSAAEAAGGRSSLSLPALAMMFPSLVPQIPPRRSTGEA